MEDTDDKSGPRIALVSIHGLIRADNPELGRDADTGGQTKYVLELAAALAGCPGLGKVELFTRRFSEAGYAADYAQETEMITAGARIVRLDCGPDGYYRKELLYPYLDEYVEHMIGWYGRQGAAPDIVHGHYTDGAYVAQRVAAHFGVPFLFTGHSLGRNKLRALMTSGLSRQEVEERYNIGVRIKIEEEALRRADLVIASTGYEITSGYELYEGHAGARFRVIPPGIDLERFYPYYYDDDPAFTKGEAQKQAANRMRQEISRFLQQPDKPLILAISRPDERKNIHGLVEAYGTDPELQSLANLAVFAGIRRNIEEMDANERQVLTDLLLLMDRHDLYGKLALPKKHDPERDIPELYRMAAHLRGVFINPALIENFGITLIEASASGLPIISTDSGGPNDIIRNCNNGILVDSTDTGEIQAALKQLLVNDDLWQEYSQNGVLGVQEHYAWPAHCSVYLDAARA